MSAAFFTLEVFCGLVQKSSPYIFTPMSFCLLLRKGDSEFRVIAHYTGQYSLFPIWKAVRLSILPCEFITGWVLNVTQVIWYCLVNCWLLLSIHCFLYCYLYIYTVIYTLIGDQIILKKLLKINQGYFMRTLQLKEILVIFERTHVLFYFEICQSQEMSKLDVFPFIDA